MDNNKKNGVNRANLDPEIRPQDDFYAYACGGWMKTHPLKPEFARYGTFDELRENNREQLRELITGIDTTKAAPGSVAKKIGDLYALGLDSLRLNIEGAQPVIGDIVAINQTPKDKIIDLIATKVGVDAFFNTGIEADMMNSAKNAIYWSQGGLGLGDRDYYLEDSENTLQIRDAYRRCIMKLVTLIGYDDNASRRVADNVIEIETALARAAMTREELRNPEATYNPMLLADIERDYPAINLRRYFALQGLDGIDTIIIGQPQSLAEVNRLLIESSEQALHDYITAGYLMSAADYLSDDFSLAKFELNRVVSGVEQQLPRWKRALSVPNALLGEAVGQLYVECYFPPEAKQKMLELVKNLKTALGEHIEALTWMSNETKVKAEEKLSQFSVKIGYPDKWRDYSNLNIDPRKSYWDNIKEAIKHEIDYNLSDWGKPVDKERWLMTPQTVNAYYNPLTNEICFPAGILQAPYFNPEADAAENYGAIGVIIGHEMTHGFDDQGSRFDKNGNLSDWWSTSDKERFTSLTRGLVKQFNAITVIGNTHANGEFTLGENIADQGGLRVAYTAYHNALGESDSNVIDGFTPDQRFYLSYANVWAGNIRDEEILLRTKTDPHSLGKWRVNGTLKNITPFMDAFEIGHGDGMYLPPEERIIIW